MYQLINLLDEEDVDVHDRLLVTEDLRRLQELEPDSDTKVETKLWRNVRNRAPGLFSGAGSAFMEALMSTAIQQALKL
jgi:hypothetical protein